MNNKTVITKSIFISASKDQVWAFLTEKDKLGKWFHTAQSDLIEGEEYALLSEDDPKTKLCWGKVLVTDRPNKLAYTFTIKPLGGAMTTVTWVLDDAYGGTKLTLTHEGIGQAVDEGSALGLFMALDSGWDSHLSHLRDALKEI